MAWLWPGIALSVHFSRHGIAAVCGQQGVQHADFPLRSLFANRSIGDATSHSGVQVTRNGVAALTLISKAPHLKIEQLKADRPDVNKCSGELKLSGNPHRPTTSRGCMCPKLGFHTIPVSSTSGDRLNQPQQTSSEGEKSALEPRLTAKEKCTHRNNARQLPLKPHVCDTS
eukprot:scaffold79820_cov38-Prasinocladus_malaysianus.AAC.1